LHGDPPLGLVTILGRHLRVPELIEPVVVSLCDLLTEQSIDGDPLAQLHVLDDDCLAHVQIFLPWNASDSRASCTTGLPSSTLHACPGSSRQIGHETARPRDTLPDARR